MWDRIKSIFVVLQPVIVDTVEEDEDLSPKVKKILVAVISIVPDILDALGDDSEEEGS